MFKLLVLLTVFVLKNLLANSFVITENNDLKENANHYFDVTTKKPEKYGAWPPNSKVCYEHVGCFNNVPPHNNTGYYLPVDPVLINTQFLLFNKKNPENGQILTYRDKNTIKNSFYDKNLPLKIVVHGFNNNVSTPWLYSLKDALLTDNVNVIITGWGNGAAFPFYNNASSNIRVVGKEMSLLAINIKDIFYSNDVKLFKIHCIGHSLGSHICGHAGSFSKSAGIYFDRISGMDPAGPFFEDGDEIIRLDPTDAKFVDAYHTNAGSLFSGSAGIIGTVGNVDFYVNGGSSQPGCSFTDVGCSHNRVIPLYTESITSSCTFIGFKCESWELFQNGKCRSCDNQGCSQMGYYANQYKTTGSLYLATMATSPFCGEQYYLTIKITSDSNKTAGEIILTFGSESISVTGTSEDIIPGSEIKKVFVARTDLNPEADFSIKFNKKPKAWYQLSDPNSLSFSYESIQINHTSFDETLNACISKTIIENSQSINHKLVLNKC